MKDHVAPTRPLCILHSEDTSLRHRLAGILGERAYVCHAPDQHRLEELLGGGEPLVLFVDLRQAGAAELLPRLARLHPQAVVVALGHLGSDPLRQAESAGAYRSLDVEADRLTFQDVVGRVIERVGWMQETQMLRDELARLHASRQGGREGGRQPSARNAYGLQQLVRATQHLDPLENLFTKVVDGVAGAAMVSRVGLFYRADGEAAFRLHAGRCCLDETETLQFGDHDPLIRWLQRHPRLITRASLDHITDPSERALLRRTLDLLGAETFIPLNLRGKVLGWLFTGQTDGLPFDYADHPELSFLSEHVVQAMENTLRHQEALSQKNLGENLLQMMSTAIITADAEGQITWCNSPAEQMFPALARSLTRDSRAAAPRPGAGVRLEDLGSQVAGLVRGALAGETMQTPHFMESRASGGRTLAVRAKPLLTSGRCIGAVALVEDVTDQLFADRQLEQLERTKFWRELAAGISHEIRNPLVAIKTFTQLLPGRYMDEEFRHEFKEMVTRELGRLDGIVGQIEGFAHPTAGVIDHADLLAVVQEAADAARTVTEAVEAQVKIQADEDLPTWLGDRKALVQCFQHLFVNGIESASAKKVRPQIRVRVAAQRVGSEVTGFRLSVVDNGTGIPEEILPSVFSPFCSSKAQGLGLGLPIAQRVVLDHGGKLDLDSGSLGLCVNITLPLAPPAAPSEAGRSLPGKNHAGSLPSSTWPAPERSVAYDAPARLQNRN